LIFFGYGTLALEQSRNSNPLVRHLARKGLHARSATTSTNSTSAANTTSTTSSSSSSSSSDCFPSSGFKMPDSVPSSLENWWCDPSTEYAFIGFSYEITACQSASQLKKEFRDIKQRFNGRYVRLYGTCDKAGYYNDVVDAAWDAELGVQALIWFGFDGGNEWESRRNSLLSTLHSNPKAKFVTRAVQFGSEPLFDSVLPPSTLAAQVTAAKSNLSSLQIPVTVSDMAFSFQKDMDDGAQDVLDAIDLIDAHMLPFFSSKASTGSQAWPLVQTDLSWWIKNGNGKKIYLTENGWPSVTSDGVEPNSAAAVANVQSEHDYFALLDSKCSYFKTVPGGGLAWFAHIYSDDQEPGYGILDPNGDLKFKFAPKTTC